MAARAAHKRARATGSRGRSVHVAVCRVRWKGVGVGRGRGSSAQLKFTKGGRSGNGRTSSIVRKFVSSSSSSFDRELEGPSSNSIELLALSRDATEDVDDDMLPVHFVDGGGLAEHDWAGEQTWDAKARRSSSLAETPNRFLLLSKASRLISTHPGPPTNAQNPSKRAGGGAVLSASENGLNEAEPRSRSAPIYPPKCVLSSMGQGHHTRLSDGAALAQAGENQIIAPQALGPGQGPGGGDGRHAAEGGGVRSPFLEGGRPLPPFLPLRTLPFLLLRALPPLWLAHPPHTPRHGPPTPSAQGATHATARAAFPSTSPPLLKRI